MTIAMQPIFTQTVTGTSTTVVTFNNIPQFFTDLVIKVSSRDTRTSQGTNRVRMNFNNDGSAIYSCSVIGGNAGSAFSFRESGSANIPVGLSSSGSSTANTTGTTEITILNYTSSAFKQVVAESVGENNSSSAASEYLNLTAGLYRSTNPITAVTLLSEAGPNFVAGSTFTLYGITKG